jgi:moderate conductance mechanosensitive channel
MLSPNSAVRPIFLALMLLFGVAFAASTLSAQTAGNAEAADQAAGLSPEQARSLANLLSDSQTRDAIIKELQNIAERAEAAPENNTDELPTGGASRAQDVSFVREIAETTRIVAERFAAQGLVFWERLKDAPQTLEAIRNVPPSVVIDAVKDLLVVMATTIVLFLALRWIAKRIFRAMGAAAQHAGGIKAILIILGSVVVDALVVVLAWASGYLLATAVFGEFGEVGIRQTLYLNAFLIVEMVKVVFRAVLSPSSTALRPVSLPDRGVRILYGWLNVVVSIIGYGQLLIVPIVMQYVSGAAGASVAVLLSIIALGILFWLVLKYRRTVAEWLLGERHLDQKPGLLRYLVRNWHIPVLVYLVGLFAIVLTRPGNVLVPVLIASGQILAAVLVGTIVGNFLRRAVSRGVQLPPSVNQRLPLLEQRLNAFVPRALAVLRILIGLIIVAFAIHVVGLIDIRAWLDSQIGVRFTGTLVGVLLILLGSFVVWLAFSSWIDYRLNPEFGSVPTSRERTLLTLLRNAVTIILVVITLMFVLSKIGIDIAPLLASAGVLGLAIGFGAQKMVQDIITGVFIQFENAINVGDVVALGGTSGVVERLTIRSVSLRDLQGVFHIIPFSSVDMVSNYMRDFAYHLCDMGVAYRESVDDAKQAMFDAFDELRADPTYSASILDNLQWQGLQAFGDSAIILRARIKCAPGQQWGVGRAYNEILKRIFDERGIEIPFPHQTIYFGEDRQGNAPPVHVVTTDKHRPASTADMPPPSKELPAADPKQLPDDEEESAPDRG